MPRARALLKRLRPDAVMGGGGYVAGPVALAALSLRIPARADRGRQPPRADQPDAGAVRAARVPGRSRCAGATGERYRVTGRPVPRPGGATRRGRARRWGSPPDERCVLVFGGSLGARTINRAAVEAFAGGSSIDGGFACCTSAGQRDYAELAARELPPGYDLRAYLDQPDFADALRRPTSAVARAGGSVFEIAAHGVPGGARALSARRRRPSDRQRALDGRGRARRS